MAQLTALTVENYKSIGEAQRVEFAPVTLVFGPNSAGKSTLLEGIQVFLSDKDRYDEVWFEHIVHQREKANDILLQGEFLPRAGAETSEKEVSARLMNRLLRNYQQPLVVPKVFTRKAANAEDIIKKFNVATDSKSIVYPLLIDAQVELIEKLTDSRTGYSPSGHYRWEELFVMSYSKRTVKNEWSDSERTQVPATNREEFAPQSALVRSLIGLGDAFLTDGQIHLKRFAPELQASINKLKETDESTVNDDITDLLLRLLAVTGSFKGLDYYFGEFVVEFMWYRQRTILALPQLRELLPATDQYGFFRRLTDLGGTKAHESAVWQDLLRDETKQEKVNGWLNRLDFPYALVVDILRDEQNKVRQSNLGLRPAAGWNTLGFADVGTGLSQVIPVLAALSATDGSLVLLQQPELHLHPAAQVELGDALLESALVNGNQIVAETHSEHVLLRLMRRIRNGEFERSDGAMHAVSPEDVSLIYAENDPETGATRYHKIELDARGRIVGKWPGSSFFGERLEEVLT